MATRATTAPTVTVDPIDLGAVLAALAAYAPATFSPEVAAAAVRLEVAAGASILDQGWSLRAADLS